MYIVYMATGKSRRNTLTGTTKGKSKSARYLQGNKKARDKKKAYDTAYHATPERRKYRAGLNAANKKKGNYGNKDGKDESHDSKGNTRKESQSSNRARNGKKGSSKRLTKSKKKK